MKPSVSILIPTYARTALLAEAIYSALHQDYPGNVQVIVLNDCVQQYLVCDHPQVYMVNTGVRIPTLGAKRKMMAGLCDNQWFALLDDDDLLMPWHLRAIIPSDDYLAAFSTHWYTLQADRWSWDQVDGGPSIAARCSLSDRFDALCDAAPENVFRQHLEANVTQIARPPSPSYVYRVGAAAFHFSQSRVHGNRTPAPFLANVDARIASGQEPSGRVIITPTWHRPYVDDVRKVYPRSVM